MKLTRYFPVIVLILFLGFSAFLRVSIGADSASSCATSSAPATIDLGKIRTDAFKSLLKGDFSKGAALLEEILKHKPDPAVEKALALVRDYFKMRREYLNEQKIEMSSAVKRVKLAELTEKYHASLTEAGMFKKLSAGLKRVVNAVAAVDDFLAVRSTTRPADVRNDAEKHLEQARKELDSLTDQIPEGFGEWSATCRGVLARASDALVAYRRAWHESQDRWILRELSEKVQDRLIDASVLASKWPIQVALSYACEAKEISPDKDAFLNEKWVVRLIHQADERGKELMKQGKWLEAQLIYGRDGLTGLKEDDLTFKEILKKINRHVRVISLYGKISTTGPTSRPTGMILPPTTAPAIGPSWREMIVGVDAAMVRDAIARINEDYVDEPDYKKIGAGALTSIRVLLETPQVYQTFPGLKNAQERKAMMKEIDAQIARLKRENKPDFLSVQMALNRILDVNSRTVRLPPEIIDMEFADGMLGEMDRFSSMIWPYEQDDFRKRMMGSFCGIGVRIRKDPGKPVEVVTPLADTPAFRVGILAGDKIIKVDGKPIEMISLDRVVKMITGPRHTKVKLTILRPGKPKPFDIVVERDEIHIRTVKGWRRLPGGKWDFFIDPINRIGYIRLTQFTADTSKEIREALRLLDHSKPPVRGIILDLRFNPGGLLTAAVDVADEFLSCGLIVYTKGRSTRRIEKVATALGAYQRGPLVVLANRYSASAAEIVSGAIKDWGRAIIVGRRTFGKGSVQRLIPLRFRRAMLKLTTAYYYLPSGRCIHRKNGSRLWGVDPDVPVQVTTRQMNRWAELRQETDLLKDTNTGRRLDDLLRRQLQRDYQLRTALLLLRLKLLAQGKSVSLPAGKKAA